MITSIGIRNLRSLRDTSEIDIKPITILVGVNSSGKSTFLRSFPLFTQSIIKPIRGSISWFDDSLVDFGDYETAKTSVLLLMTRFNSIIVLKMYLISDIV